MPERRPGEAPTLTRRQALASAGAAGLGLALQACGGGADDQATPAATTPTVTTRRACVLTPEQTEGPYYVEDSLVRRDITENRQGVPLQLRLNVQDVNQCQLIEDATVEVWHCDAVGVYSGVNSSAGTFLRGAQRTDAAGTAVFDTVYPGWYPGRTPHIHVKVHVGGEQVHTGQLYFDEGVTGAVYRRAPYASHGEPTASNSSDGLYAQGGRQSTLDLTRRADGYIGRLVLGVRA